jgi:hypothetical protein
LHVALCFHVYENQKSRFRTKGWGIEPIPYVRNADSSVDIPKHSLEKLVCKNARSIIKAEQAMIGENRADSK